MNPNKEETIIQILKFLESIEDKEYIEILRRRIDFIVNFKKGEICYDEISIEYFLSALKKASTKEDVYKCNERIGLCYYNIVFYLL